MLQAYNYFNQQEIPSLTLCTPNKDELFALPLAYEIKNTLRYNALSELEFNYPQSSDGGITIDSAYVYLKGKMLVEISEVGFYIIQSAPEDLTGSVPIKHVSAFSLEAEMLSRRITGFTGTYQFQSLLQIVLNLIPTWSIGTISPSLLPLYRTFVANNSTILNFLFTDMEKAYGCIFEIDTFNRTISAISNIIPSANTDIFLSFDNLIKSITFKEISEEICTGLYCYGAGSLTIHNVNPLGGNVIYNFTNYKTTAWMSQGLINALTAWEANIIIQQPIYAGILTNLETYHTDMIILQADMSDLNGQLSSMETVREARIQQGLDTVDIDAKIAAQQILITSKGIDIATMQQNIDYAMSELRKIVHSLYFTSEISYTNFEEDVNVIKTNLEDMMNNWGNTYNSTSTSPGFNPALLIAKTQTINNLLIEAGNEIEILRYALATGFSSYPPVASDLSLLTGYINQEIITLNELYSTFQSIIPNTPLTVLIDEIRVELIAYLDIISYPANMTETQYLELCPYIYENTYTNSNIIITDSMTPLEIQAQSQELYDQSITVLAKVSVPRYEFSGEFSNFIALENFSSFTDELDLGKVINIRKDDNSTIEAVLLELVITYDNPTDFSMTFSNSFRLDNSSFIYSDILGAAAQLGSNVGVGAITEGSIAGWTVNAGSMSMPNASISSEGYISFGTTPPTTYGNNIGAWLGYDGAPKISLYSNVNNYFQWDGSKLLIKAENFTLDNLGNITATNATLSGSMTAGGGAVIIDDDGITFDNNAVLTSLNFLDTNGNVGARMYMNSNNILIIRNYYENPPFGTLIYKDFGGGLWGYFSIGEDPGNANVLQCDLTIQAGGAKITMGGDFEIRDYGGYRYFRMVETAKPILYPTSPGPYNYGRLLYPKTDGWYDMNYLGVETKLTGASVADIGSTAETLGGAVSHGTAATASRSDHKHAIINPAIDTLASATNNTNLNATVSAHGLLPILPGGTTNFLRADGTWNTPSSGSELGTQIVTCTGTNDHTAINAAIAAAVATGGGRVRLVGASAGIGGTLTIAGNNVILEATSVGYPILNWAGSSYGTMLQLANGNNAIRNITIRNLKFNANNSASIFIAANNVFDSSFINIDGINWAGYSAVPGYAVVLTSSGPSWVSGFQSWVGCNFYGTTYGHSAPSNDYAYGLSIGVSGAYSGSQTDLNELYFANCSFMVSDVSSAIALKLGTCDHIFFTNCFFMEGYPASQKAIGIQISPQKSDSIFPADITFTNTPISGGINYDTSIGTCNYGFTQLIFNPYYTIDSQRTPPLAYPSGSLPSITMCGGTTDYGVSLWPGGGGGGGEAWTNISSFGNGWYNYNVGYQNPAGYFKDSFGVVHLRGLIAGGTIGLYAFILPSGYWPPYQNIFPAITSPNAIGRININGSTSPGQQGWVVPYSGSNAWICLDGITFRVT